LQESGRMFRRVVCKDQETPNTEGNPASAFGLVLPFRYKVKILGEGT